MRSGHVLITGATGQLGSAFVRRLAPSVRRLSLCALDEAGLADLAGGIAFAGGPEVVTKVLDVRDAAAVEEWITGCDEADPIDWIVTNAGLGGQVAEGALLEDPDRTAALIDANLNGTLHSLHALLPRMRKRGGGHVIVVSSLSALLGYDKAPVYAASKAAVRILCLSLRPTLRAEGIGLTVACPGFLDQPMTDGKRHHWRPFSIDPDAAADKIVTAAGRNRGQVAFPAGMVVLLRLLSVMPLNMREATYRYLSR